MTKKNTIGVLSLQGDVIEHKTLFETLNTGVVEVKTAKDLEHINGLVIPGGESTTIRKLLTKEVIAKIKEKHHKGMAIWGTCAGTILLSKHVIGGPSTLDLLDISVKRNGYGSQLNSFEATLKFNKKTIDGVFIRAPIIDVVGPNVTVLSTYNNHPVMVQQNNILASTFHPELTEDTTVAKYFLELVKNTKK